MKRLVLMLAFFSSVPLLFADSNDDYKNVSEWFQTDPNAGVNSFPVLLIPGGGKLEGMGTAYTAVALDAGYLESNPAIGSFLPRTILSFSHNDWIADSSMETLSFAYRPKKLENMSLGFGFKYFHVPFTAYDDWGSRYSSESTGQSATGRYSELIVTTNISYNFLRNFYFDGLSVGGSLKVGYRGLSAALDDGQNAVSLMGDFGLMTRFNFLKGYVSREKNFAVGMAIRNMGVEFIENPNPLPSQFALGLSYKPIRPLILALDFTFPFNINGEKPGQFSIAAGANVEITNFFSAHGGLSFKAGKPRFSLGADFRLGGINLLVNYSLDLTTQFKIFDRMSVMMKMDMQWIRRLLTRDEVQNLYLDGLDFYTEGKLTEAIIVWENCLSLDPDFTPAQEMIESSRRTLELQKQLDASLGN